MNEANFRYLVLDTRHPEYSAAIKTYEAEAKKTWPNNVFSVVPNVDGSQVLIKIDAGKERPTWDAKAVVTDKTSALVVREFTVKTHDQAVALLQTKEWKKEEEIKP